MTERFPVVIVLSKYLKLHLILSRPPFTLLMKVLLQQHDESKSVHYKELLLLFTQLPLLFFLLLAHDLCALIDLLDALLDLDKLLQLEVVLRHELVRLDLFLTQLSRFHLHQLRPLLRLIIDALVPGVQSVECDDLATLLQVLNLVHLQLNLILHAHIRLDLGDLPLLVD